MRDETIVTVINPELDDLNQRKRKDSCLVAIYGSSDLGRKYSIDNREMCIGRGTSNDIVVGQESVSRKHAFVLVDESGIKIRDNESTNGTYVNDNKIHETYLRDGDLVKIGRSMFKFLTGDNIESSYHDEIYRLSTIDALTQVFNRRYFQETLARELSRARRYDRPLALLMFDIDYFKRVNDTYGHRAGDFVLRRIAELVQQRARKVDVVARYGGEEFAVILPEIDTAGGKQFAEKIRRMVEEERFLFEGQPINCTVSAGIAELNADMANSEQLVSVTDARLYRAKESGRNVSVAVD
jgi:diguanylate cyclase (GGDEF)-like protein